VPIKMSENWPRIIELSARHELISAPFDVIPASEYKDIAQKIKESANRKALTNVSHQVLLMEPISKQREFYYEECSDCIVSELKGVRFVVAKHDPHKRLRMTSRWDANKQAQVEKSMRRFLDDEGDLFPDVLWNKTSTAMRLSQYFSPPMVVFGIHKITFFGFDYELNAAMSWTTSQPNLYGTTSFWVNGTWGSDGLNYRFFIL